jgi:hypothetical protein
VSENLYLSWLPRFVLGTTFFFAAPWMRQKEMIRTLSTANVDRMYFISNHNIEVRGTINDMGLTQGKMKAQFAQISATKASSTPGDAVKESDIPCNRGIFCEAKDCGYLHPLCPRGKNCKLAHCNNVHGGGTRDSGNAALVSLADPVQSPPENGGASESKEDSLGTEEESRKKMSLKTVVGLSSGFTVPERKTTVAKHRGSIEVELRDDLAPPEVFGTSM